MHHSEHHISELALKIDAWNLLFQAGFMPFIQNTIAEVLVGFIF